MNKYIIIGFLAVAVGAIVIFTNGKEPTPVPENQTENILPPPPPVQNPPPTIQPPASTQTTIASPISNARSRITKKRYGTYVTPTNSPVSPEKFTGYHNAVDFEATKEEETADVPIMAVCDGPLLQKRTAQGYGGVAVQSCNIDNQAVTVVYGHVRISSISTVVNEQLKAGQQFAVLGTGFSAETDNERKHLHLGIHKGTAVNIAGYLQIQSQLNDWLDPEKYLP